MGIKEWNQGFATMGGAMALYILKKNKRNNAIMDASQLNGIEKESDAERYDVENSVYWKIWSFGLFHASFATTLYFIKDKAFVVDLDDMLDALLFENLGLSVK